MEARVLAASSARMLVHEEPPAIVPATDVLVPPAGRSAGGDGGLGDGRERDGSDRDRAAHDGSAGPAGLVVQRVYVSYPRVSHCHCANIERRGGTTASMSPAGLRGPCSAVQAPAKDIALRRRLGAVRRNSKLASSRARRRLPQPCRSAGPHVSRAMPHARALRRRHEGARLNATGDSKLSLLPSGGWRHSDRLLSTDDLGPRRDRGLPGGGEHTRLRLRAVGLALSFEASPVLTAGKRRARSEEGKWPVPRSA